MEKKKFAFLMMGTNHDPEKDHACFEGANRAAYICVVRNYEEAKVKVLELQKDGIGAIELCGAFGKEKAQELTELTGHQIAIGYVVHEPELDSVFAAFFEA